MDEMNKEALVESIFNELRTQNTLPSPGIDPSSVFELAGFLTAKSGEPVFLSAKADRDIAELARGILDEGAINKEAIRANEWQRICRQTIGNIYDCDRDGQRASGDYSEVLKHIRKSSIQAIPNDKEREFSFGCVLFDGEVRSFSIGPARFEPRLEWLERRLAEGNISKITANRLRRLWQGQTLKKRKPSWDAELESGTIRAIGGCGYVCSVKTENLSSETGKEKALLVARMALAAIGLRSDNPSNSLRGMTLLIDRNLKTETILSFRPGVQTIPGLSRRGLPIGPRVSEEDWQRELRDGAGFFSMIGELFEHYLEVKSATNRPNICTRLFHALLWIHEGCREPSMLMATIHFTSSLDAMANGESEKGILNLLKARLGVNESDPIRQSGPTFKMTVSRLYGMARSRTLHGNNEKIGHDWTEAKKTAETLARYCFMACVDWAVKNPGVDDPNLLRNP